MGGCKIAAPSVNQKNLSKPLFTCVKCNTDHISVVNLKSDLFSLINNPDDSEKRYGGPLSQIPDFKC